MKLLLTFVLLASLRSCQAPPYVPLGCLSVDASGNCLECDQSNLYYLISNFCGKNFDPNCLTINASGACTSCRSGFFPTGFGYCFYNDLALNCLVVDPSNPAFCQLCLPGFTATAGVCAPSILNCSFFDPNSARCLLCVDGYLLTRNNTCVMDVPNCQAWYSDGYCSACVSPYGLSATGSSCLVNIPGCLLYRSNANLCQTCYSDRQMSADSTQCVAPIPNCLTYTISALAASGYVCHSCQNGFYLASSGQLCVAYDNQYCAFWDATYTTCLNCISGFVWNPALSSCIRPVANCQSYFAINSDVHRPLCQTCNPGFFLDSVSNACSLSPVCNVGSTFCAATGACVQVPYCCASSDSCGNCQTFKAGTGWCAATQSCFTYHEVCPGSYNCVTGTCDCPAGQSWCSYQRQCLQIPSCCQTHDGCGNCLTYMPGYSMCAATGQCYALSTVCPFNYDCGSGQCVCQPGYYWSNQALSCQESPRCCDTTGSDGRCLTFKPLSGWCPTTDACYYYPAGCPNGNWNCTLNQCNCPTGQTWCPQTQSCTAIPACCKTWDNCGHCLTTLPGWAYCALDDSCVRPPNDCVNYDCQSGRCFDLPNPCAQGQTLCYLTNTCVNIPACCTTYDDCGNCLTTQPGWSFCRSTASCYQKPANCSNWDCANQVCADPQLCGWGQTLCSQTSACVDIPFCCLSHDDCGNCLTTLPFTGVCQATNQCYFNIGCQTYDCVNNVCLDLPTTCPIGTTFCTQTLTCNSIPPCCLTWDSCGNCLTFVPNAGYCTVTKSCYIVPDGCPAQNYDCVAQRCDCGPGFSWCTSLSQCVAIPSCCATHDACGNCLSLQPGQNYCPMNEQCFNVPAQPCQNYDCVNQVCLDGSNPCPAGSTFCPFTRSCLQVPGCCATYDACGNCLTTVPGMGWCQFTGQCYLVDPTCNHYDCLTNTCLDSQLCPSGQAYCPDTQLCLAVPPCCLAFDPCYGCLRFAPGTGWCAETNTCFFLFTSCQNYDCVNHVCLDLSCPPAQSYCGTTNQCVDIPLCCLSYDSCGNCLETKPGWVQCPALGCLQLPSDCLSWDCTSNSCLVPVSCPAGQIYCVESGSCVAIPPCCQSYDSCGRCTGFFPGSGWCAPMGICFALPLNCVNYDCVTGTCLSSSNCLANEEFCAAAGMCVPVPSCCALTDGCGQCLTYKDNQGWCSQTSSCYIKPADCNIYDCVAHTCLDSPADHCTASQEFCSALNACVEVPPCCDLTDGCGNCMTYRNGTGWCSPTSQCYTMPAGCLIYDCETGICLEGNVCTPTQKFCAATGSCVEVPSCCALSDDCGNCLTYLNGTGWCSPTSQCYSIPPGCLIYDCEAGVCLEGNVCTPSQKFCAATNTCVDVPSCCAISDDCGNCLTYVNGTGWCSAINSCYTMPAGCLIYDCEAGVCLEGTACNATQKLCPLTNTCVDVPSCCDISDQCGNCLIYQPQTMWCSATSQCVYVPADCASFDCVLGICVANTTCPVGQSYCPFLDTCVQIPSCCETHNDCGECTSYKPNQGWCSPTNACYTKPDGCILYDCQTNTCAAWMTCNPGQSFCADQSRCVPVPSCCDLSDGCGNCTTYLPGTGWCSATNSCYTIPLGCQIYDCVSGQCLDGAECTPSQTFCPSTLQCMDIPSCCTDYDVCGTCYHTAPNTAICPDTGLCYNIPADCPIGYYDCQHHLCRPCDNGSIYCPLTNQCQAPVANCAVQLGCGLCNACAPGYFWDTDRCSPIPVIPNCANQVDTICAACDSGFVLSTNACYPAIPDCFSQLQNTCVSCNGNLVLQNNGCVPPTANCQAYNNGVCVQCAAGYILNNAICYAAIQNCGDQTGPTCNSCIAGFFLFQNVCIPTAPHCSAYDLSGCTQCDNGYLLNSGICYPTIPSCQNQIASICSQCAQGFVLLINQCRPEIPFCQFYGNTTCLFCQSGYTFFADVANPLGGACFPTIPGCSAQFQGACNGCLDGLLLQNNMCIQPVPNCVAYLGTNCAICQADFVLYLNACYPAIPSCGIQEANQCVQCQPGFVLSGAACVPLVPGCSNYLGANCVACDSGFMLYFGQCFAVIPFCAVQEGNTCAQCISNYVLDGPTGPCFPGIPNCLTYANQNCVACQANFVFEAGFCFPVIANCVVQQGPSCVTCATGYSLLNNFCWNPIWQCTAQVGPVCSSCATGYVLDSNSCIPVVANCALYSNGVCASCFNNFILDSNVCYPVIPNCADQTRDVCNSCATGYTLIGNSCIIRPPIANCAFSTGFTCLACNDGYYLNDGNCISFYCIAYNPSTLACTGCMYNAALVNGVCTYIEGCSTYNLTTNPPTCSTCLRTFILSADRRICLGPAHFIFQANSSQFANPAIGYFVSPNNGTYVPAYGSFNPGSHTQIWYFAKNSFNGYYTIKLAIPTSPNGPLKLYYLATDGLTYFLTASPSMDLKTFWLATVQSNTNANFWSIQSAFSNKFLGENLALDLNATFFKVA